MRNKYRVRDTGEIEERDCHVGTEKMTLIITHRVGNKVSGFIRSQYFRDLKKKNVYS